MGLKQIINRAKIIGLNPNYALELELPKEPLIYSIKQPVGKRTRGLTFFRNIQWRSIIRCYFPAYVNKDIPVAIIVRFFVTPPAWEKIPAAQLKKDNIPATHAYELCDYLLSFQEILYDALFKSYSQVIKLDAEKFYSNRPRTVFQFMKWDHYVKLQTQNTVYAPPESISALRAVRMVQPASDWDDKDEAMRDRYTRLQQETAALGATLSDRKLLLADTKRLQIQKALLVQQLAAFEET